MTNYEQLKADIAAVVRANGIEDITGDRLQQVLTHMVDVLGNDYALAGVATPTTNPPIPDGNTAYIAGTSGTYTYFLDGNYNPLVVPSNCLTALLMYDASAEAWAAYPFGTIAQGTIGTNELADGAVTTPKIANSAVTTPKINDGAVSEAKLAAAVQNKINNAVTLDGAQTITGSKEFTQTVALNGGAASDNDLDLEAADNVSIRANDGTMELSSDDDMTINAHHLDINNPTGIDGDLSVIGDINATGDVDASGDIKANGKVYANINDELATKTYTDTQLATKQDTIADLSTIRAGAALGATAYQKPLGGIPESDLSADVQASLGKADSALQDIPDGSVTIAKIASAAIDATPTANSGNLVTSGGVAFQTQQINEQLNSINITSPSANVTPFIFKAGATYHVKNNSSSQVTISHRNTPSGTSEDLVTIVAGGEVDYTPTTDGLYLRYGAACNLDIYMVDGLYDTSQRVDEVETVLDSLKFHTSVAKYSVKAEIFKSGLYWYKDISTNKVASLTNSSTMAGVLSALDVVAGDNVRFNITATTQAVIVLADSSDNVIAEYNGTTVTQLCGKLVIPTGCTKLYFNTLQSSIADSYLVVNGQYMNYVEGEINTLKDYLWVIQPTEIQTGKGVQSSTGNIVDATNQKAVVINLTQVKAKRIKFVLTASSTYGYGFIVNGTWTGKRYSSFPSGLNYQQLDIEVPEGATEFRFSWSSTLYTGDNPIYCILEDALMQVYEGIGEIISTVTSLENAVYKERVLDISDNISDGGILLDGTFDTNTTFGHVEISLNEDVVYKSFTFKKTYVNNSTRCCYGFVVNNQWVGYQGMASTQVEPEEVTVVVPEGATIFRVSWNRNIITDDNYVLKALATADGTVADVNNKPVFQFTPDFVLSRVPQLECPPKATVLALKPAQVYTMYDGLMASYPNYITKVDCDAVAQAALEITAPSYMEGLPIYMYKFTPKIGGNGTGADQTSRFKILITSMHPQEKFGILATFNMAKMICENWANDVNAEQLRSLIDIYIMPCPWPWNMENGSRANYNGVNGNRQFPTSKWVESGQGTSDWSGTAPLSEYEAKVINYFLLQIQPHVSVDVHTSGNDNVGHMGIFLVNQFDQPLVDLCGVIARTTSNRAIQDNSNFPQDGDTCMYGVYPEDARAKGEFYEYAYEQGCKYSVLSEESPYSNWTNGVFSGTSASPTEEYTDGILREQVQYIFNTVLRLTKAASIQYYSE